MVAATASHSLSMHGKSTLSEMGASGQFSPRPDLTSARTPEVSVMGARFAMAVSGRDNPIIHEEKQHP